MTYKKQGVLDMGLLGGKDINVEQGVTQKRHMHNGHFNLLKGVGEHR